MNRLAFAIVVLLILCTVPVYGQSALRDVHEFGDWEYITNGTGLTITAYRGNGKNIEIPENIYGINVTALDENLFKSNITIQSVVIPDTVTSIGGYAFHGCTSLADVSLPKGLTRIETNTFRYCTSLTRITLPDSLNVISSYAFAGCINLSSVDIPDTVTSIGEYAFDACADLTDVKMSKNLNYLGGKAFRDTPWLSSFTDEYVIIGNSVLLKWNGYSSVADIPYGVTMVVDAFEDNSFVETVNIPNSVNRLGAYAFSGAVNLKNIVIPDSVTRIDGSSFLNCRSLRSIHIPDSVQYINGSAFRGCEKLAEFIFPPKVETINSYVLADCKSLTDVVIPTSVGTIHEMAFSNSPYVRLHVTYDSLGEQFAQEHEMNYTYYIQQTQDFMYSRNDDGIQILLYIGKLYDVDIPSEIDGLPVNRINTAAFQNNSTARTVTIPNTVKTIGDWAFSYMDSLEEIDLPSELESLGADAFTGSMNLQSITLPGKLKNIGVEPFASIPDLKVYAAAGSFADEYLNEQGYPKTGTDDRGLNIYDAADEPAVKKTVVPAAAKTPAPDVKATPTAASVSPTAAFTVTPTAVSVSPTVVFTNTPTAVIEDNIDEKSSADVETLLLQATVAALKERNENRKSTPSAEFTATAMALNARATDTQVPTSTATPVPTDTAVPTATATSVPTDTQVPTSTATSVPTNTAVPTATATSVPTNTAVPTATATPVPTDTLVPTVEPTTEPVRILTVEDGASEITSDMLRNTAEELTLIIPESVTYIDDSIVKDHKLTIVSSTGTEAERFARKWDIKFLLKVWYDADAALLESMSIDAEEFSPED